MSTVHALPTAAAEPDRRPRRTDRVLLLASVVIALGLLVALFGPLLAPADPDASDLDLAFVGPSPGHPLGFDGQGRDLLSRLLVGARSSLLGPLLVVVLAMGTGVALALVAAWRGGWVDRVIATVLDVLFAFPGILLAVLAAAVFGTGLTAAALALAVAYTPYVARVLRSAALQERRQEHIAAGEVLGLSALVLCVRHILPNVGPLVVAQSTLLFGYAMVDLAAISFLGLGVQPPQADWGVMVAGGQSGLLQGYVAESLAAGGCLVAMVVAVTLAGERLSARREGAGA